jgi:PAS domain S-box-containing protein
LSGTMRVVLLHNTTMGFASDVEPHVPDPIDPEHAASHLAAIVETSEDAIISKTLEGRVLTWNKAAERIYGYMASEVFARPISILLPPERRDEEAEILEKIRRGERVEHFETTRRRKDGHMIDVSITISPIRDSSGAIVGASHIARDITERTRLQEQFRNTQKLESLGVLAGGVAHDFNNLLTGILGNTSLALELLPPNHSAREMLRGAITASERAADLTRQLLAYAGKGRFVTDVVRLSALVREISQLIQTSIPRTVQLRLELANDLPYIEADVGQMQQLVMNLVINGAEAIGEDCNGTVIVTTAVQEVDNAYIQTVLAPADGIVPGSYVSLEVHDTGCGMDQTIVSRIFDPFFTTKFLGRGLGLAAVQGIVRGHKGVLKVYSQPGKGSTFKVLFPITQKQPVTAAPRPVADELAGYETILVIDDEQIVRHTAKTMLESYGYRVLVAENGREGVDLFRLVHEKVALVILDMSMPVMSGEETLRNLKLIRSETPVILSSGFNEVEAIRRFAGKGLAGFIQKPYSALDLARRVKMTLHRD